VQAQDVTGRRVAEAQLHELAFHDTVTGLPNRRRFMQCLEGAVSRALADPHYGYAVMYLDFDRFKLVNDSLGHSAGDALLVQLARRLQARLRPSDVVARLGGDEFALLTERSGGHPVAERGDVHERDVHALAERLMEALHAPFDVAGHELQVSASIGVTFGSLGYLRAEEVLRDADTAMYKAKADGRARIVHFDGSLHADVSRRLRLEGDLRRAIEQGALTVAYQSTSVRIAARPPAAAAARRRALARGAGALAPPHPGAAEAGGVPADRRGVRPDDARVGLRAAHRLPPGADLAAVAPGLGRPVGQRQRRRSRPRRARLRHAGAGGAARFGAAR
jgi:diguanylate cyclase (GGDEF)-like protein